MIIGLWNIPSWRGTTRTMESNSSMITQGLAVLCDSTILVDFKVPQKKSVKRSLVQR